MHKATILFADNDSDFLRIRAEFLEQEGYLTVLANNATEARRKLELGGIDLAVLDLRITDDGDERDRSGLDLAKEAARSVPTIIMTAFPTVDAVREALSSQPGGFPAAVEFVTKKEGSEALLQAVRRALSIAKDVEAGLFISEERSEKETVRRAWVRLIGSITALVTLLLAMGTGVLAIVFADPRWLLATVFTAILAVVGIGLAVFMPE
jgi:DNA-binding NtrC family response regulator